MQRTWKLSGGYATWSLTLTTSPAEGAVGPFVDDWAPESLDRLGQHFFDVVDLLESHRLLDERTGRGSICS